MKKAYRGRIFYFTDTATYQALAKEDKYSTHHVYIEEGVLIVENGHVVAVGKYSELQKQLAGIPVIDYQGKLITPGFIDTHVHATQSGIVAAYGSKLLEWLDHYVFPGESSYHEASSARNDLNFFIDYLLRNGTTTAVAYGPFFSPASDIFFEELHKRNMRFVTGNILMDENAPDSLRLTTQENYDNTEKLMKKWHNKGRLSYCISPRFALACSEKILELCGALKKKHPDLYIQTHLDENVSEVEAVQKLYPWSKSYLDVYHHFGLVTDRSVFGHCIHLKENELELFAASKAIMSWCPLSNNFLGSGLFNFERVLKYTDRVTLGTDWGGGTALSMFAVMDDAYKVAMLQSYKLPSLARWYLATLGSARALQLDHKIGNFTPGKEADFIVIDPYATPYLRYRLSKGVNDIFELLFVLMTIAREINIEATYVLGEPVYLKQASDYSSVSK